MPYDKQYAKKLLNRNNMIEVGTRCELIPNDNIIYRIRSIKIQNYENDAINIATFNIILELISEEGDVIINTNLHAIRII